MNKHEVLYIAGAPATGKTTLMAHLTRDMRRTPATTPLPHELLGDPDQPDAIELGHTHTEPCGTDAIGIPITRKLRPWLEQHPAPLILGEGTRLATRRFLTDATDTGHRVLLAFLRCDATILSRRRPQPWWYDNYDTTQLCRLADIAIDMPNVTVVFLDATQPVNVSAHHLRSAMPALHTLVTP